MREDLESPLGQRHLRPRQRLLQADLATGGITLVALLSACVGKETTQAAVPVSSVSGTPDRGGLPTATTSETTSAPSRSPARAPGVAPATFAGTYAQVQSGVLRLDSSSCTGGPGR